MEWYDVCDDIAHNFHTIETTLNNYVSKHGAILKNDIRHTIGLCIGIAGENKFEITSPDVPTKANTAADVLYKKLEGVEKCLLEQVHSQSST